MEPSGRNVITQMLAVYPDLLGDQAPPPAPEPAIEELPIIKIKLTDSAEGPQCPICLCAFDEGEEVKKLPCSHLFHKLCIQVWLSKSGTCPLCRFVLVAARERDYSCLAGYPV